MGFLSFLGLGKQEDQLYNSYTSEKKKFRDAANKTGGIGGKFLQFLSAAGDFAGNPVEGILKPEKGSGARDLAVGVLQGVAKAPETAQRSARQFGVDLGAKVHDVIDPSNPITDAQLQERYKQMGADTENLDPVRKALYGTDKLETYQTRSKGNEKVVEGSRFRNFSPELGALSLAGTVGADFLGNGGGKAAEEIAAQGAKEVAPKLAEAVAKNAGQKLAKDAIVSVSKGKGVAKKAVENAPEVVQGKQALDQMVQDAADALLAHKKDIGGVTIDAEKGTRASSNPQWYRDFYAANKRAPNKAEVRDIAQGMLDSGSKEISGLADTELYSATKSMLDEVKQRLMAEPAKSPAKATLYRGANGEVSKVDKQFSNVLDVPTDQEHVIRQLAADGNKDAQKLLDEAQGWGGKIQYKAADDVIKEAHAGKYDAIRYNNEQLPAKGVEYHDLTAPRGQDFLTNQEATAKAYAGQSRASKYSFLDQPKEGQLALPAASDQAILDARPSVAQAKREFLARGDKTNLVGEGLQANAEIPYVNKLRPSTKVIKLPEAGTDLADATLRRTKAGNLVPISKLDGVVIPPNMEDVVKVLKPRTEAFLKLNLDERLKYALRGPEGKAQYEKLYDYAIAPRAKAVTDMVDEHIALKDQLKSEIIDGLGINDKAKRAAVQDFGEKRITSEALIKKYGEDQAGKIMQADQWFRRQYDDLLGRMNAQREATGKAPIPRREDYYTHFRDLSGTDGIINPNVTSGGGDFAHTLSNPYAKERLGHQHTADAVASFEHYMNPALAEIHMTEPIARTQAVVDALDVEAAKQGLKDGKMSTFLNRMQNEVDVLAGRPVGWDKAFKQSEGGARALKAADWITGKLGKNTILGSARSAIMQTLQIAPAAGENGYANVLRGISDELAAIAKGEDLGKISPFIRRRNADTSSVLKTFTQKGEHVAAIPFEAIEQPATHAVWRSSYRKAIQDGYAGEEAIKQADRVTERLVAGRSVGEKPWVFGTSTGNVAYQFQLEVNQLAKQLRYEWTPKQLIQYTFAAYAMNAMMEKAVGQRPLPDPIETGKDIVQNLQDGNIKAAVGRAPAEVLSNVAGGQAIAGLLPENVRKEYLGKTDVGRYAGNIPVGDVASAVLGIPSNPKQSASDLISGVGTPFAGRPIRRALEGVDAANKGYSESRAGDIQYQIDRNPVNMAKAAILGKYATDGGKEYSKEGLRNLSSTQSDRVKAIIKSQENNPDRAEADRIIKTTVSFYQSVQRVSSDKKKAQDKIKAAIDSGNPLEAQLAAQEYNAKLKKSLSKFIAKSGDFLKSNPAALAMLETEYQGAKLADSNKAIAQRVNRSLKEKRLLKVLENSR